MSNLRKKIQHQMEFYLSSSNLRQDKYLLQHQDEERYIAIDVFVNFAKMKKMKANIQMVQEAVKKSKMLELSSDGLYVRRSEPIEAFDEKTCNERSIYVEGFSKGVDHDSLRQIFNQVGKVLLISMPRFKDSREFKGFAFVEFENKEAVQAVIAQATNDNDSCVSPLKGMRILAKTTWLDYKETMKENIQKACQLSSGSVATLRDVYHNKKSKQLMGLNDTQLQEQQQQQQQMQSHSEAWQEQCYYTPGLLLKLRNVTQGASRKLIRQAIEVAAPVAYLDDTSEKRQSGICFVRFLSTSHAQNVLKYYEKEPLRLLEETVQMSLLAGDEEEKYWNRLVDLKESSLNTTTQKPSDVSTLNPGFIAPALDTQRAVLVIDPTRVPFETETERKRKADTLPHLLPYQGKRKTEYDISSSSGRIEGNRESSQRPSKHIKF